MLRQPQMDSTGVIRISLDSRLDSFNFDPMRSQIETLVKIGKYQIVLDASQLKFLSFPGAYFFHRIHQQLEVKGGYLRIQNVIPELIDKLSLFPGLLSEVDESHKL